MADTQNSTGRRKTASARVYLSTGSGSIIVNNRPLDRFFGRETARMVVRQPLELVGMADKLVPSATGLPARWSNTTNSCAPGCARPASSPETLAKWSAKRSVCTRRASDRSTPSADDPRRRATGSWGIV